MSDITITAASCKPLPGAIIRRAVAGTSIVSGAAVYLASTGYVELADADDSTAVRAIGIVAVGPDGKTSYSSGDAVDVVTEGPIAGASSLTIGGLLYSSTTAGSIANAAATASGDYIWVIGRAESAAVIYVHPWTYDVAAVS